MKLSSKQLWSYINNRFRTSTTIPDLVARKKIDNEVIFTTNSKEKADILSNYFASVFTYEPETLPKATRPMPVDILFSTKDVEKQLVVLKLDQSPGPDGLHPRIFNELANFSSPYLTSIYRT